MKSHEPKIEAPETHLTRRQARRIASHKLREFYADDLSFLKRRYMRLLERNPWLPLPGRGSVFSFNIRGVQGPLFMRRRTGDYVTCVDIFGNGEYEPVFSLVNSQLRLVVDLGANVGYSVRLWMQHFPRAKILAVEPSEANARICQMNVAAGPSPGRVEMHRAFIAGDRGEAWLDDSRESYAIKMSDIPVPSSPRVTKIIMEDLLTRYNRDNQVIDLLKVDIEGAECGLFAHCDSWIRRVSCIIVETHHPLDTRWLINLLKTKGIKAIAPIIVDKPGGCSLLFAQLESGRSLVL